MAYAWSNGITWEVWGNQIKAIAESGADVIVAGGKIGDLAVHYINKYNMPVQHATTTSLIHHLTDKDTDEAVTT